MYKTSLKAYGNYNFKFQDQSKIGDLRLFKAKSVFKYNISSAGLKAIDIVGYVDDGGNSRWKIHPKLIISTHNYTY